jgi:catechol 2,3-dioxygenase-like lactoylglutathione lyase family enzyme
MKRHEVISNAMVCPTIPASDMARAKDFYGTKLGLSSLKEDDRSVMYQCGGGTILSVYETSGAGTSQARYASFKVDDIEAEMKVLRDKGVVFEDYNMPGLKTENGVATAGDDKAAWFKDSEGNILCLNEMS